MFLVSYFGSLNRVFLQLFSLPLLIKTYFKPWKNEYREGFIITAIFVGIAIKTPVILVDLVLLALLLAIEIIFVLGFIFWPIGTLLILII